MVGLGRGRTSHAARITPLLLRRRIGSLPVSGGGRGVGRWELLVGRGSGRVASSGPASQPDLCESPAAGPRHGTMMPPVVSKPIACHEAQSTGDERAQFRPVRLGAR